MTKKYVCEPFKYSKSKLCYSAVACKDGKVKGIGIPTCTRGIVYYLYLYYHLYS